MKIETLDQIQNHQDDYLKLLDIVLFILTKTSTDDTRGFFSKVS